MRWITRLLRRIAWLLRWIDRQLLRKARLLNKRSSSIARGLLINWLLRICGLHWITWLLRVAAKLCRVLRLHVHRLLHHLRDCLLHLHIHLRDLSLNDWLLVDDLLLLHLRHFG